MNPQAIFISSLAHLSHCVGTDAFITGAVVQMLCSEASDDFLMIW